MKYINVLIGIVVFSVVATILFGATYYLSGVYSSSNTATYNTLQGRYNFYEDVTNYSSVTRKINNNTQAAELDSFSTGSAASKGALAGLKTIIDSTGTIDRMSSTLSQDTNGWINPLFILTAKAIFWITLVIIILSVLWRAKLDSD